MKEKLKSLKKLGFGLMRLPMNGDKVDIEATKQMVDGFMENGYTYFDTAYVYLEGKSESILKETVVDRYPREAFQAATKLPLWECESMEDIERIFEESLTRAGLKFYDFYLIHAMDRARFEKAEKLGVWEFLKGKKTEGKIKHIGFSFHDSAEVLAEALEKHHEETEFIQLQINYVDWESESVQSKACYDLAVKYDIPVIVMEPVKGGALAALVPEVQKLYQKESPTRSLASWAMRYVASLDHVFMVLSGMSNFEQMEDNIRTFNDFTPLGESEKEKLEEAVGIMKKIPTIPCTDCKYCVEGCPQKIAIPQVFGVMNNLTVYNNEIAAKSGYESATKDNAKASECIACGACEEQCPQHIAIIEELGRAASRLEN